MSIRREPPAMIFLMGPTGAGKTELAVALATRLAVEVISVDSAMVYRDMDIGTAKPSKELRARVPHRLVDICEPEERYSAARFRADARREIDEVVKAGKVPLLVGGTGLYFRALERGLARLPGADPKTRRTLERRVKTEGLPRLYEELLRIDPGSAARIHRNDPQRILRALEVFELSGRPMSALIAECDHDALQVRIAKVVLAPSERRRFHEVLADRFRAMLQAGLVDEVRQLLQRPGIDTRTPAMRLVGYRQIVEYLNGEHDYETAIGLAITATRQLAKRQLTWLRGERGCEWYDCQDERAHDQILKFVGRDSILTA